MKISHKASGFLAIFSVFAGWGLVMGGGAAGNHILLYGGGTLLGIGVIYLLFRLYKMAKKRERQEQGE